MEQWESLVKGYPSDPSLRDFTQAVETAEVVIKEDLAPFEMEWFLQTLMTNPVHLLRTMKIHLDESWARINGRCFTLLKALGEHITPYQDDIVKVALLPHRAATRKLGLSLLRGRALPSATKPTLELLKCSDQSPTVRGEAAWLIGTICAQCPESINDKEIEIWRTYLSILESNEKSDLLVNGILLGLNGLFQNFGMHLPTLELNAFYDNLSRVYFTSCFEATLQILTNHSRLFPEKLTADVRLRTQLWAVAGEDIKGGYKEDVFGDCRTALTTIYGCIVTETNAETIVTTEIHDKTQSAQVKIRSIAYPIMSSLIQKHGQALRDIARVYDKQVSNLCIELDYNLTSKLELDNESDDTKWKYDSELVYSITQASWCIEHKVSNAVCLLRSMIMLHSKLPSIKRRHLVAHTILKADSDLRNGAVIFLTTQSCVLNPATQTADITKYLQLWSELFDTQKGKDNVVLEHSRSIFKDFINYVVSAFDEFLESTDLDVENSNLPSLLLLASEILHLENAKDYVTTYLEILLTHLLDSNIMNEASVRFTMDLVRIADENCMFEDGSLNDSLRERLSLHYKRLHINASQSEGMSCAVSLAIILAPTTFGECGAISALQLLFSRRDAEPVTLLTALKKLENLLHNSGAVAEEILSDIVSQLDRIRLRKDITTKGARILRREILLFLGKYRDKYDEYAGSGHYRTIMKLKDLFVLSLPISNTNSTLKLSLARTLELALIYEDPKALGSLLHVLCSYLSNKHDPILQEALTAVIHKLSRCHARQEDCDIDSLSRAVIFCDSTHSVKNFVVNITSEKSPGVRKILSALLETCLLKDPHSGNTENLLRIVIEEALLMMATTNSTSKMGGLDLVGTIINALKENSALTVELMPDILRAILKSNEKYAEIPLQVAIEYFQEKQLLVSEQTLQVLLQNTYESVMSVMFDEMNLRFTSRLAVCLIKNISNGKDFLDVILNVKNMEKNPLKTLLILTEANMQFQFEIELKRRVVGFNDFQLLVMLKRILTQQSNEFYSKHFGLEVAYKLMKEYADVMLEVKYSLTIECLIEAINQTKPEHVKKLYRTIEKSLITFQNVWKIRPQNINNAFGIWCQKLPLEVISTCLKQEFYNPEHILAMAAFKRMLIIFNYEETKSVLIHCSEHITKLPRILLNNYASDHAKVSFKSNMAYMTDILAVSLVFLKPNDAKALALECHNLQGVSNEKVGLQFCETFIKAFGPYFLGNELLLDDDMKPCAILVHDIIKLYGRQNCGEQDSGKIVNLLDKLWPTLESQYSFVELINIMKHLTFIESVKVPLTSHPGRWWLAKMAAVTRDEQVILLSALPVLLRCEVAEEVKEMYTASLTSYSLLLRSGVCSVSVCLSTLIPLCRAAEPTILDLIVTTFAESEHAVTHSDTILSACAAALVQSARALHALHAAHVRSVHTRRPLSCLFTSLLVPAIRQASIQVCEEFFSEKMNSILSDLRRVSRVTHKTFLIQYTRAFTLAQLAFEKLPLTVLESPSSKFCSRTELKYSKSVAQELCKLCLTLRSSVTCPEDADDELKDIYRKFQQANFNCMAAVLCKTKPRAQLYEHLLNKNVWPKIIDCSETWVLHIQPLWSQKRTKNHIVPSAAADLAGMSLSLFTRPTGTFYTTLLSDNPKAYVLNDDLHPEETQQVITLVDNCINSHACAGAAAAAFKIILSDPKSTLSDPKSTSSEPKPALSETMRLVSDWLKSGLSSELKNVRWFLAQTIINCKEELQGCGAILSPLLLKLIAETVVVDNNKKHLNGLHMDILNAIVYWNKESATSIDLSSHDKNVIKQVVELIIHSCLYHKNKTHQKKHIPEDHIKVLGDFLNIFSGLVEVKWDIFADYLNDAANEPICLDLLLCCSKNKIYIPELFATIMNKSNKIPPKKRADILGLQLSACPEATVRADNLTRMWKYLDKLRASDTQDYVKVLFYSQIGCKECCNEINFRHAASLAPKMVSEQKSKCYEIISTYIALASPSDYITAMFDNISLCDSILGEHTYIGLRVAKNGLRLMEEGLKRRVVFITSDFCTSPVDKVRKLAIEVMLKAFEEIFASSCDEPSRKRLKTGQDSNLLKVLRNEDLYQKTIVGRVGQGLLDDVPEIADITRLGILPFLADDISVRFSECLLICVYAPLSVTSKCTSSYRPSTLAALVRLLLEGQKEVFLKTRLRDESLDVGRSGPALHGFASGLAPSKLSLSRTYQGTFRSHYGSGGARKKNYQQKKLNTSPSLQEILESFLQYSQTNLESATAVFAAITEAVKKYNNMTLPTEVVEQLEVVVSECGVGSSLPVAVAASRYCVEQCCQIYSVAVATQKDDFVGSQAEYLFKLMREEIYLRANSNDIYVLGKLNMDQLDDSMENEADEFTMEDLISSFGKLSDWNNLTMQQKERIHKSSMILWTNDDAFHSKLDNCDELSTWLAKLRCSLRQHSQIDQYLWLKELDVWPLKRFDVSTITEAIEWHTLAHEDDLKRLSCSIKSDCLAEWSARLMCRSSYLKSICHSDESEPCIMSVSDCAALSRSHELAWSEEANARGLCLLALQCVKRNTQDLMEREMLSWLHQQVQALRTMGIRQNDTEILKKALQKTEMHTSDYKEYSTPDVVLSMNKMKLLLNRDLGLLTAQTTGEVLKEVDLYKDEALSDKPYANRCRETILSVNETAVCYFDEALEQTDDITQKTVLLSNMAGCLTRSLELNSTSSTESYLAMVLHRIDQCEMVDQGVMAILLAQIEKIADSLNEFLIMELKRLKHLFPPLELQRHVTLKYRLQEETHDNKLGMCLQLVCDPQYTLMMYLEELRASLIKKNGEEFDVIYKRISSLFGNQYAGPSFQLLTKYKTVLDEIKHYQSTEEYRKQAISTLENTITSMKSPQKNTLNLSELCPTLASGVSNESDRDRRSLCELLGLEKNVEVVRFEKQVSVCRSLRRPCIIRALLSTGATKRMMVKRGERLQIEAAAREAHALLCGRSYSGGQRYRVRALGEDSSIIEHLEDHVTLAAMISRRLDYNEIVDRVRRPVDDELILKSPAAALSQFNQLCSSIPALVLRSSIEEDSTCLQDFIRKKRNFTESVAAMTLYDWVLGLGDRHLENILYGSAEGAVCSIDWAAIFQHGGQNVVPELPPARLTRLIVAVCDLQVLESRQQSILSSLRDSVRIIMPYIRILFKWLPEYAEESYQMKLKLTESIMKGELQCYHVTRQVLEKSPNILNADKYVRLLYDIFEEYPVQDCYDVEQQISCFLRQCTEPRILSITRSGWQPYL